MTLWAGRVGEALAPEVWDFLRVDDLALLPYDCEGTLLHAKRLRMAGILSDEELAEAKETLERIGPEDVEPADEDVHSTIERLVGPKIGAGRSRNDQVATALKLYVADACAEAIAAIEGFAGAILDRAEGEAETPMPGYTHLQRAQGVTVGHHLLAWVEMLERDRERFRFAAAQAVPVPLGAGALAGSTLDLPAPEHAMRNSLDAVADRDFALDYLYAVAVCFGHLSRIGEELVIWSTAEFGFVHFSEESATERLATAASDPLLRATDAAEALVREGAPFRDAHEQIAAEVRAGAFEPPQDLSAHPTPGAGGVHEALSAARARLS